MFFLQNTPPITSNPCQAKAKLWRGLLGVSKVDKSKLTIWDVRIVGCAIGFEKLDPDPARHKEVPGIKFCLQTRHPQIRLSKERRLDCLHVCESAALVGTAHSAKATTHLVFCFQI